MKAVFCRETAWDELHPLSTNYLARALAHGGWEVLWLTRPWHPGSFLLPRWGTTKKSKLKSWIRGGQPTSSGGVWSYAFATLLPYRNWPLLSAPWVGRHSLDFSLPPVRRQLRRLGFARPDLLFVSDLAQLSILDLVPARRAVLHVTDDYSAFAQTPPSVGLLERWAAEKVDAVVTPKSSLAAALAERHGLSAEKLIVLPHGVDSDVLDAETSPPEFGRIPRPRAVYLGALADWLDWGLLDQLARLTPEVALVFIGGADRRHPAALSGIHRLKGHPNVHFLGPRSHSEAMSCLADADAALIPFVAEPPGEPLARAPGARKTFYSAPMKLMEYLSFGLPVISTLRYWEDVPSPVETPVYHAPDAGEFVAAVQQAVRQGGERRPALRAAGRRFAQHNSWDLRAEELLSKLGVGGS
jgi:glycosyltransferase involved in cell wall biosynthesis